MAYNIRAAATINNSEYTDETDDYSVREYGEVILNSPAGTFNNKLALDKLIEEMLNYGAKAQVFFDRIPENPANINVKNYSMAPVTSDMITAY